MNNPEFRQTLHNISHNFESANQAAQENIYTFAQRYVDPCLESVKSCIYACTAPCFPNRDDNIRRRRGRSRGRAEYNFDFYNAWDDDEAIGDSSLGWNNDELDSLLAGHGSRSLQPRKQRRMSYGSRGRRKSSGLQQDPDQDPTIIPSSSYLGFLERLPWRIGSRKLRYKPSAADLQENPGGTRVRDAEVQPLIEEADEDSGTWRKSHGRQRSDTAASRSTTNSLSSRGDLIMSDEDEDAQPLDDEFAVMLSRRNTNQGLAEDQSSGKTKTSGGKRPGVSRNSTRTVSSKSLRSPSAKSTQRSDSQKNLATLSSDVVEEQPEPPSLMDLRREEEQVAQEEELEIRQKREAAQRLALHRGLSSPDVKNIANAELKPDDMDETRGHTPTRLEVSEREPDPISSVGSSSSADARAQEQGESTSSSIGNPNDGKDPT
ncbi:uncharacterized protein Z520_06899 [Fonsecaea multimorphosa CBS 102226]|uniref:Uncharacterized protein n=1 Tax=Fonsecaea multimorphosa CBS 102226 TaxID=1442371 RepID=A0A0D2JVF9_9EURO|nr:uncharacterized protein Z520_06899 [Fonsecaea multimorphosa CBS 102226]KIX97447.1 hypothetical protein Z520_06899 [Fonsecaea multimorphosa CBS 102226]OAL23413.1 hypothetical protein AYO22_06463 [Fonsecaea multimorphosa]